MSQSSLRQKNKIVWTEDEQLLVSIKKDNRKGRNTMKKESIAKQLTLQELKELPRATVVWVELRFKEDNGILWHAVEPGMIISSGDDLFIVGGGEGGYFAHDIAESDDISNWFLENAFWNQEPTEDQVKYGLSEKEFNEMPEFENVAFPNLVTAISSKKLTIKAFCGTLEMKEKRFYDCLIGKKDFTRDEIERISSALDLTDYQIREIFFPELAFQYVVIEKEDLAYYYKKYCSNMEEV